MLYNENLSPMYMLTHDFKNQLFYSPGSRFIALAAFQGLNGQIEIFDLKDYSLVGKCVSRIASYIKWSSDAKRFLTAIVNDKLKVDHEFTIFSTTGQRIKNIKMKVFDLINIDFAHNLPVDDNIKYKKIPRELPSFGLLQ